MFFAYNFHGLFLYFSFLLSIILIFFICNLNKQKKIHYLIGIMIFILLCSTSFFAVFFRDFAAPDNYNYIKLYSRLLELGEIKESVSIDYGYIFLLKFFSYFNLPPEFLIDTLYILMMLIIIMSIIIISPTISTFLLLSFITFFLWGMLDLLINTQRQGLAISFIILAFSFRFSGNIKLFVFSLIIASSFHWTGYLAISIIIFSHTFSNRLPSNILFFISFCFFIISLIDSSLLFDSLSGILDFLSLFISPLKVISYKINWYLNTGVSIPLVLKIRIALEFLFFNTFFIIYFWKVENDMIYPLLKKIKLELAIILLFSSFFTWSEYAFRIYNLFTPYIFILLTLFLISEKKRTIKINYNLLIFFVLFFVLTHATFWRSGILFQMYRGI